MDSVPTSQVGTASGDEINGQNLTDDAPEVMSSCEDNIELAGDELETGVSTVGQGHDTSTSSNEIAGGADDHQSASHSQEQFTKNSRKNEHEHSEDYQVAERLNLKQESKTSEAVLDSPPGSEIVNSQFESKNQRAIGLHAHRRGSASIHMGDLEKADSTISSNVHDRLGYAIDEHQDHPESDEVVPSRRRHSTGSHAMESNNRLAPGEAVRLPHRGQATGTDPRRRMTGRQLAESSAEGNAIRSRMGSRASARMKDFRMGDAEYMRARLEEFRLSLALDGGGIGLPEESPSPTLVPAWSGELRRLFRKLKSTPVPNLNDSERRMLCLVLREVGGFRWMPFHALMRLARRIQYMHLPRNGLIRDQAAGPWDECVVVLKGEVQYRARGGEEAELARLSSLAQQHLIMLHDAHAQAQVTTGEDEAAAARALDSALGPTFATHPAGSLHRELALLGQDTLATESLVAAAPTEVLIVKREALREVLYQCNCMYIPDVCYNYLVEARIKAENHPKAKTPVPPALAQALTEMLRMQFEHLRRNEVEMMIKHLQVFDFQTHQVLRWDHSTIECDWLVLEGDVYLLREEGTFMCEIQKPVKFPKNHVRPSPAPGFPATSTQPLSHSLLGHGARPEAGVAAHSVGPHDHTSPSNTCKLEPHAIRPRLENATHPTDAADWLRRVEMHARRLTSAEDPDPDELKKLLDRKDTFDSEKSLLSACGPSRKSSLKEAKGSISSRSYINKSFLFKEQTGTSSSASGVESGCLSASEQGAAATSEEANSSTAEEDPSEAQASRRASMQNRLRRARMSLRASMLQQGDGCGEHVGGAADVAALVASRQANACKRGGDDEADDVADEPGELNQGPKSSTHTGMSRAAVRRFSRDPQEVLMASKGESFGVHGVRGSVLPAGTVALVTAGAKLLLLPKLKLDVELAMDDEMTEIARVLLIRPDQRTERDIDLLLRLTINNSFVQELPKDKARTMLRSSGFESCQKYSSVYSEGEKGSTFYIILQGEVSIHLRALPQQEGRFATMVQQDPELAEAVASKQMGGCVATRPKGASFGELALINNKPRAATVFALQRCFFMTVNKKAYQSVIGKMQMEKYAKMAGVLRYMQPLEKVTMSRIQSICVMLHDLKVGRSHVLITEGEPASNFYIVYEGELKMVRKVPASMRQQGGKAQVPARVKNCIKTSHGLDISQGVTLSSPAQSRPTMKVYLPGQVEVGRMRVGDWFGEEVLLGTCTAQPWTVTMESQSGGVYFLEKQHFMNVMTSDAFPSMLGYLEQIALLKQDKAETRFQAGTTKLTSMSNSSDSSAFGNERHVGTSLLTDTTQYALQSTCRSSLDLPSTNLLEPISRSPRCSLISESRVSQYDDQLQFASPALNLLRPDSLASDLHGSMSVHSTSASPEPEPLMPISKSRYRTPRQHLLQQHPQQIHSLGFGQSSPSGHHSRETLASSSEPILPAACTSQKTGMGAYASLSPIEPRSRVHDKTSDAVTMYGSHTHGLKYRNSVAGPASSQSTVSRSCDATVLHTSRQGSSRHHEPLISPHVSEQFWSQTTIGAQTHRHGYGGKNHISGLDMKHSTVVSSHPLETETKAQMNVHNGRPFHLKPFINRGKVCSQGPLCATSKTVGASQSVPVSRNSGSALEKLAVTGTKRTKPTPVTSGFLGDKIEHV